MLFNSLHFFIFFIVVLATYYMSNHKFRWVILLASSYYFYMQWNYKYIILILISTVMAYAMALLIQNEERNNLRKLYLSINIITSLGILIIYKYYNFFNDSLRVLFERFDMGYSLSNLALLLPMGISFYTFQTLSYTIDVYRKDIEAEKHFGKFALYVTFFPQLVAGPIERSKNLLPQFSRKYKFNYDDFTKGFHLIFWGLFKKVVIADQSAVIVNTVYNDVTSYSGIHFIIATVFFAIQIYCDFSGYSDMAIGIAKTMGFDLMKNFEQPYFSKSIGEFWKRWHISLSTWFKDYLYIPLGGNRVKLFKQFRNILITFLISGLWHGANWTFVIWGLIHGIYLVAELVLYKIFKPVLSKVKTENFLIKILIVIINCIKRAITFILVLFAWIFFRANSISDGKYIVEKIFVYVQEGIEWINFEEIVFNLGLSKIETTAVLYSIIVLIVYDLIYYKYGVEKLLIKIPLPIRWAIYYAVIIATLLFRNVKVQEFIYFQF